MPEITLPVWAIILAGFTARAISDLIIWAWKRTTTLTFRARHGLNGELVVSTSRRISPATAQRIREVLRDLERRTLP